MPYELEFLTRRGLVQLGAGGYLGLNLGGLWRARASASAPASTGRSIRACILVFQYGGPSHLDTLDLKPAAPAEVRGSFRPISTTVPGIQICEHLPRLSRLMRKAAIIRSVTHGARLHDSASIHALTGRPLDGPDRELFSTLPQFFPSHGSALAYMLRSRGLAVPFASLPFSFRNVHDVPCQGAGFLGSKYDPFRIEGDPARLRYQADSIQRPTDLPGERVRRRHGLLGSLESSRDSAAARSLYEQAHQLLDSQAIREAIDLERESLAVRERYGFHEAPLSVGAGGGGGNGAELGAGRQLRGQNLLLARRLVEAGVPFVTVYDFKQQGQNWDAHFQCEDQHRRHLLPQADQGLSALIEDLDQRGLLESTLVVVMGEFGRTPRINGDGGRDHWPDCYSILLAGGGVIGGAVYGSSDRIGAFPATEPVTPGDIAATIFWRFGLDHTAEIHDQTSRPHRLAAGEPIRKLFS